MKEYKRLFINIIYSDTDVLGNSNEFANEKDIGWGGLFPD